MWFKQLYLRKFQNKISYDTDKLELLLAEYAFKPCSALHPVTIGFVPPLGDDDSPLVYAASGYMLFCMQIQEKVLPAVVLREEHMANVKEMEKKLGYRIARGERLKLKEEIAYTLLNQAFSQSKKVYAYIDTKTQQLIVSSASNKILTQVNALFDKTFYDFSPVEEEVISPASIFTAWLSEQNYPAAYAILDKCAFEDESSKAKVSFSHKDLYSDSVECILREGARVTKLSLSWNEKIEFTLDKNFMFSGIKFLDEIKDLAADNLCETAADRFATDFFIMAETLRDFLAETQDLFSVNAKSNATNTLEELGAAAEVVTV